MAWIESHQSLANHPKLFDLARSLEVPEPYAIGLLHLLWWWVLDYAPTGDLSSFSVQVIARSARWPNEPKTLVDALVSSGFIDRTDNGLRLHNWGNYAGRITEQRAANKTRKQLSRERHMEVTHLSRHGHRSVTPMSQQVTDESQSPLHPPSPTLTLTLTETGTPPPPLPSSSSEEAVAQELPERDRSDFLESLFTEMERNGFGLQVMNGAIRDQAVAFEKEFYAERGYMPTPEIAAYAVREAVAANARNWRYILAVLQGIRETGQMRSERRNGNGKSRRDSEAEKAQQRRDFNARVDAARQRPEQ